ncbi:hypothetical protein DFS34DRAFT_61113 [Phlyctochytrium arcticum]|nr:hypothetical protein DFS34DRAFT_61113 [Phlyctochytrium arcticum]
MYCLSLPRRLIAVRSTLVLQLTGGQKLTTVLDWRYDPPFLRIHTTPSRPLYTSSKPFPLHFWLTNESLPILHRKSRDHLSHITTKHLP